MDFVGLFQAVFSGRHAVVHQANPVIEQGCENESGPHIHGPHEFGRYRAKSPSSIGFCRQHVVSGLQCAVEIDHARDKMNRECSHAAKVKKIDAAVRAHRVVAEMGVSMNHAVSGKRAPPRLEKRGAYPVPGRLRRLFEINDWSAFEPCHRNQTIR